MILQKRFALVIGGDRGPCQYARFSNWAHLLGSTLAGECEFVHCSSPILDGPILAHTAVVVLPRVIDDAGASVVRAYAGLKKRYGFEIVLDYDDLLWDIQGRSPMPDYNPSPIDSFAAGKVLDSVLPSVDRVLCSTEFLAYCFCVRFGASWASRVSVLPNYAFTSLAWSEKHRRKRPCVLYGGSGCHFKEGMPGDFGGPWAEGISEAVKMGLVEFHAFGDSLGVLPEGTVLHGQVHASMWLATLSNIAPDVVVAPLANNPFNKAKTPLKALEAACVGAAFVASDFPGSPYREFTLPACRVGKDARPVDVTDIFGNLVDRKCRAESAEYTRHAVASRALVAEMKPARDYFVKALFGKFVEVV